MRDAVRGLPGQLGRVGAADQQVAGVQAQRDGRAFQHALHFAAALDHGADVRVQDGADAAPGGQGGEPVEVGQQSLPAGLVEVGPGVVAVAAGGGGQHEDACAGGVVAVEQPLDPGHRVVAGLVQDDGGEAADRGEVPGGQQGRHRSRVGGEEPVRTELGGGQPDLGHLV